MIVFDLDDTLYKERDYLRSGCKAVAQAAAEAGIISLTNAQQLFAQMPIADAFNELSKISELFTIDGILHIYRTHMPDIQLSAEVEKMLSSLPTPLGIITDGRSVGQWAKIHALGLERYVSPDDISVSEDIGADKRQPLAFEKMMKRHSAESEFIYVGDNPLKDFHWPNIFGWKTIMLKDVDGVNIHKQSFENLPVDYLPQIVVNSIAELQYILLHNHDYVK
jgi:putative hydrolase of the HAD superfamily